MRVAYRKTEECSLNQLLVDLLHSAHLPSRLNQRGAKPYFLGSVWVGSKDSGVRWAGSLPKQQPLPLPLLLQRSLLQELLQVVFQETEPTSMLQPTLLQEPVADLGFLNGGQVLKVRGLRRCRHRGGMGSWYGEAEGLCPCPEIFKKILVLETAYYRAFWRCIANISTLQSTSTIYTVNELQWHTRVHRSLAGPEN